MDVIATDTDFLIPQHRAAAMSYLQTLAATGYHYWNAGSVHYGKAAGFLAKIRALYPIDLSPGQRGYRQESGQPLSECRADQSVKPSSSTNWLGDWLC